MVIDKVEFLGLVIWGLSVVFKRVIFVVLWVWKLDC